MCVANPEIFLHFNILTTYVKAGIEKIFFTTIIRLWKKD